jgi:tRNA A58 N-methylase Trm61
MRRNHICEVRNGEAFDAQGNVIYTISDDVPTAHRWASAAQGRVLEVGLGTGRLSNEIAKTGRVKDHVILEDSGAVIAEYGDCVPDHAILIRGSWPDADLPGRFDVVYLDILEATSSESLRRAASLLVSGGCIYVRK